MTYSYEFRHGMLVISLDGLETACRRTALDRDGIERLITGLSDQSQPLSGTWTTAWREENSIWMDTFIFDANGSFIESPVGYDHPAYTDFPEESDWYVMPMGHPSSYGTYTFDGQTLILTYLASDVVDFEYWTEWVEVIPVGGDLSNTLELDGQLYIPDSGAEDQTEIWGMVGVDYSVR